MVLPYLSQDSLNILQKEVFLPPDRDTAKLLSNFNSPDFLPLKNRILV